MPLVVELRKENDREPERVIVYVRPILVRVNEVDGVRDAAMLASAQAIERYEITRYGTLVAWADQIGPSGVVDQQQLGSLEIVDLLQLSLDEEKNQDARLTALAESRINRHAVA